MRFPSVVEAADRARETALRFPLALLAGVVAAVAAWIAVGGPPSESTALLRIILAAVAGIPLLFVLVLDGERRGWSGPKRLLTSVVGLVVPVGFFLLGPDWSFILLFTRFFQ
ncbi:MAG: hypothetical protein PVH00_05075, partial [Gemmatimonadota bacterium]